MPRYVNTLDRRTTRQQPRSGIVVSDYRDDYDEGAGSVQITPARLGMIMRSANTGNTESLFELFDIVEQDPHVHAVLGKRKRRIYSRSMQVTPANDTPAAEASAELVKELVLGKDGRGGIINFQSALRDLTDAIGKGFSLMQVEWDTRGAQIKPVKMHFWPQRFCFLGDPVVWPLLDADEIRIKTHDNMHSGTPITNFEKGRWIAHVQKSRSGPIARTALLRTVAWFYLFKRFSIRDWSIFIERYGIPIRIGKYPVGTDDKERNAVLQAILQIGKDGGAVLPVGAEMDLLEAKLSGSHPHKSMADFCNAEISKAIEGATLTTEAGERGARSLGTVHQDEQSYITDEDVASLSETLKRDLFTPVVQFNLGDNAPVPSCSFLEDQDEDLEALARTDSILVNEIGLPLGEDYFYERYDRPKPEGDDVAVRGKPAPAPSPFQPGGDEEGEGEEEEEEAVAEAAAATGLTPRVVRVLARSRPDALFELASVKKKSTSWAK